MSITYDRGEFLWQISRSPPLAPDYRKVRYCQVIRSVFWLFFLARRHILACYKCIMKQQWKLEYKWPLLAI